MGNIFGKSYDSEISDIKSQPRIQSLSLSSDGKLKYINEKGTSVVAN